MRENRPYGSMRGGARMQKELATTACLILCALARLLYWFCRHAQPNAEALGYYRMSLRDENPQPQILVSEHRRWTPVNRKSAIGE
jgi:hypothetical protein